MKRATIALLLVLFLPAAFAGAAEGKAAKKRTGRCPDGKVPVIKGAGKKARFALDRKGRLKCVVPAKPKAKAIPRPSAGRGAQLSATADQLGQVLAIRPDALKPIARRIGAKRAAKLVALGLDSWQGRAVAAETKFDTYSPGKGVDMDFKSTFETVDNGSQTGFSGSATVEGAFTRRGLDELIKDKADITLPKDIKDGRIKVELAFSDLPGNCPDANGKVKGSLKASGRLTLTVGGTSVTLGAKIDATYTLTVGEDARWHTIDDLVVTTEFQVGGTGRGTETWRGRRVAGGLGTEGIFGASNAGAAITRDLGQISTTQGGTYGPHGGITFANSDAYSVWDLRTVDNVKGLIATNVASSLATLAVAEYVRKVAAERVQKIWFDDEKCLRLDAAAAKSRLKANETTPVTARNARAADGAPVPANLTATGTQSIEPGSAQMPAGASKDFTLTAPGTSPVRASYKIVALSRAGKKTVSGSLEEAKGYTIVLDDHETGSFATHDAAGVLSGTVTAVPGAGAASGPVAWSALSATSKIPECVFIDPRAGGAWSATVEDAGGDRIRVAIDFTADTTVEWSVNCQGTVIPEEPGTSPLGFAPRSFELPAGGGTQPIAGTYLGWTSSGTLTVTPTG